MTGLDQVKGPHWSQILALYGSNGTINEVLKDRNQVQLKDKARNLKLFFLKSNIEVPHYLSQVTGELRTRAPSQAAKREMQNRQRILEENQGSAQLDSIMALSSGLHEQDRDGDSSRSSTMSPFEESNNEYDAPEQLGVVEVVERSGSIGRDGIEGKENERLGDEDMRMRLMEAMPSADAEGQ